MPVYLVTFNTHPDDDTSEAKRLATLRETAIRSVIEQRFPESERISLASNVYLVDTDESMVTVWAIAGTSDEVVVVPLSPKVEGCAPEVNSVRLWLQQRLEG